MSDPYLPRMCVRARRSRSQVRKARRPPWERGHRALGKTGNVRVSPPLPGTFAHVRAGVTFALPGGEGETPSPPGGRGGQHTPWERGHRALGIVCSRQIYAYVIDKMTLYAIGSLLMP